MHHPVFLKMDFIFLHFQLACLNIANALAIASQSCSGVRKRVKIVSKRNYTEDHFMSDFTLLEEAGRVVVDYKSMLLIELWVH